MCRDLPVNDAVAAIKRIAGVGELTARRVLYRVFGTPLYDTDHRAHQAGLKYGLFRQANGKPLTWEEGRSVILNDATVVHPAVFLEHLREIGTRYCSKDNHEGCPVRDSCDFYRTTFVSGQTPTG
jgi:endonuclease III